MINKNTALTSYSIVQATKLLGMSRDDISYLVTKRRLVKALVQGRGKGKRTRLSFRNLLDLALIKMLRRGGLDLNVIEDIRLSKEMARWENGEKKTVNQNLWDIFAEARANGESEYIDLMIHPDGKKWAWGVYSDVGGAHAIYFPSDRKSFQENPLDSSLMIFVRLHYIVKKLEEKTGEKL